MKFNYFPDLLTWHRMLVPCAHTQSPDSQRRAPCKQSLSPISFPDSLSYLSLRRESMGRRKNLGTSLSLSLAQFWRTIFFPLHSISGGSSRRGNTVGSEWNLKVSRTYFANNEEQTILHERIAKTWHLNARSEPVPNSQLHHPTEKRVCHNYLHMRMRSLLRLD